MVADALRLVIPHLLSVVGFLMALVLLASSGRSRRPTGSTIAWLLAFLLIPYLGVPLFLLIGRRKLRRRSAEKTKLAPAAPPEAIANASPIVRMLCAAGARPPTSNNTIQQLATGEEAFAAVVDVIEAAKSTIHVSTLIFADDEVGTEIARRLATKAEAGVTVRVLVDALFKFRSSRKLVGSLRRAGVKVAWFMPIWGLSLRRSANLRLHRKVILVDGATAIVGGMNLAREYMGPTPIEGRWRDLSLRLYGDAARDVASVFAADWEFATREALALPAEPLAAGGLFERRFGAEPIPDVPVQVVASGPDVESDLVYDAVLSNVFEARRRLWIATPYFVPDDTLARALALAVRRGVDVRLVVPRRSNHRTADLAGGSYLRELARIGARIECYEPGMMHAKVVLVDDDLAILGSANMDMRSFFLDYEIALYMTSPAIAAQITAWFATLFEECGALEAPRRSRAILESVARLLAPLE